MEPLSSAAFIGKNTATHALSTIDDKEVVGMFHVDGRGKLILTEPGSRPTAVKLETGNVIASGSYGSVSLHRVTTPSGQIVKVVTKNKKLTSKNVLEQASDQMKTLLGGPHLYDGRSRRAFMNYDGIAAYQILSRTIILMARASCSLKHFTSFPRQFTPQDMQQCPFLYEHQIAQLSLDIMSALEYLRGHDIYYFDIKADNVLVYTDGTNTTFRLADHGSVIASATNDTYPCTYTIASFMTGRLPARVCKPIASHIYVYLVTVGLVYPLMLKLLYVQRQVPDKLPSTRQDIRGTMPNHIGAFRFKTGNRKSVIKGYRYVLETIYRNWIRIKNLVVGGTKTYPTVSNARQYIAYLLQIAEDYFREAQAKLHPRIDEKTYENLHGKPFVQRIFPSVEDVKAMQLTRDLAVNPVFLQEPHLLPMSFATYDESLLLHPPRMPVASTAAPQPQENLPPPQQQQQRRVNLGTTSPSSSSSSSSPTPQPQQRQRLFNLGESSSSSSSPSPPPARRPSALTWAATTTSTPSPTPPPYQPQLATNGIAPNGAVLPRGTISATASMSQQQDHDQVQLQQSLPPPIANGAIPSPLSRGSIASTVYMSQQQAQEPLAKRANVHGAPFGAPSATATATAFTPYTETPYDGSYSSPEAIATTTSVAITPHATIPSEEEQHGLTSARTPHDNVYSGLTPQHQNSVYTISDDSNHTVVDLLTPLPE